MAPTPYTANARLRVKLVVSAIAHFIDLACNYSVDPLDPSGYSINAPNRTGGKVTVLEALNSFWSELRPMYHSSVVNPTATLDALSGGTFIPLVFETATAGVGTGGASFLCSILTFTFKDVNNKRANILLPEASYAVPIKQFYPMADTNFLSFTGSVLADAAGATSIGSWLVARGSTDITRSVAVTGTLSRRLRKIRALA